MNPLAQRPGVCTWNVECSGADFRKWILDSGLQPTNNNQLRKPPWIPARSIPVNTLLPIDSDLYTYQQTQFPWYQSVATRLVQLQVELKVIEPIFRLFVNGIVAWSWYGELWRRN